MLIIIVLMFPVILVAGTKPEVMHIETPFGVMEYTSEKVLPNGIRLVEFTASGEWGDAWEGTYVQYIKGVEKNDKWSYDGWGIFEGVVHTSSGDLEGTVYYRIRNTINFDPFRFYGAQLTIISGTGELANIRGTGDLNYDPDLPWIDMSVHFDP